MQINEIFAGLQGEGILLGTPAVFIRAFGCSNSCKFCDSPYSWNRQTSDKEKHSMSVVNIITAIDNYNSDGKIDHWVFTGGEPMLQVKEFTALLDEWERQGRRLPTFEIETNGKQSPIKFGKYYEYLTSYNVSPKLSRSMDGNKQETFNQRINEESMKAFVEEPKAVFKFVIADQTDINEMVEIKEFFKIPTERIMLMPLGRTVIELNAVHPWLIKYCLLNNYRFAPRLHIMLFNGRRGV